jgi:predicted metal-dependent HD superfamily phosphohydrolase
MTPRLEAAYDEPHRRYHTRAHIDDCLAKLAEVPDLIPLDRRLLTWAIWWHDAIYDPTRADNEERSARMACEELIDLGATRAEADEVARLIRLTKGHAVEAGDPRGALIVSIDLSILGAAPAVYDAYAAAVRQEYIHVPEDAFRAGRRAVLQSFLAASRLFPDDRLSGLYDAPARANLRRELGRLG